MNVLLNDYCNFKCSYCFAEDTMCSEPKKVNMSIDDLEKVIDYHKKNKLYDIRLIGGEPTLHPKFTYILNKLVNDSFFRSVHIFSNMSFKEEILEAIIVASKSKKVTMLPNCNERSQIGDIMYDRMLYNLSKLAPLRIVDTVGINIYRPDIDYKYIYDIANRYNIRHVRWALTIPNKPLDSDFDLREYVGEFEDVLVKFFKDSVKYNKEISIDCNSLPLCKFSDESIRTMMYSAPKTFVKQHCGLVIDVKPNLEVIRCFGLSDEFNLDLDYKNSNYNDICKAFDKEFYEFEHMPLYDECKKCLVYKNNGNRSCGCIKYRIAKFKEDKD